MKKLMVKLSAIGVLAVASLSTSASTINANDLVESGIDIVKVKNVMPVYPSTAITQKKHGQVVLSYDLNKQGEPENIKVVSFKGTKRFIRSSVQALAKTRFEPVIANDQAVTVVGLQKQYDFLLLDENSNKDIPGLIAFNL
ncbi:energy transducer TonB [Alteromonadaceae bacterium M269]|nr:energy transducer TonB [Alteromonadaceae bacterium M269]